MIRLLLAATLVAALAPPALADGRMTESAETIGQGAVALGLGLTGYAGSDETTVDGVLSLDVGILNRLQLGFVGGTQALYMGSEKLTICHAPEGTTCGLRDSWNALGGRARWRLVGDRSSWGHLGIELGGSYQHAGYSNVSQKGLRLSGQLLFDAQTDDHFFMVYGRAGYAWSDGVPSGDASKLLLGIGVELAFDLGHFSLNPRLELGPELATAYTPDLLSPVSLTVGLALVWKGVNG